MAPRDLSVSRAELFALVLRACRGAGLPQSHGEDFAVAVSRFGDRAAIEALARALVAGWRMPSLREEGGRLWVSDARATCDLPVACDALFAGVSEVRLEALDEPGLIAPFLARETQERALFLRASGGPGLWVLKRRQPERELSPPGGRITVARETFNALQSHAAKTYVPATQTSRQGAGAGAIDND
ncbi:MAG: hypothetical protein AAF841_08750 [Pseudomonadota bacterium]